MDTEYPGDIEIARQARLKPVTEIADLLGVPADAVIPFGHDKAKLAQGFVDGLKDRPDGKLVLVTAINPTPMGEGKTTTTVGLGDALNRIGRKTLTCLREPSLGPCFGMKGGAAGGGRAQVVPMEALNLHFTGDMHAITAAHNLLSAMIDNHVHWENALGIDPRRVSWPRVMDMNDRALREIVVGLGGAGNGQARETGFDITVASEVMAILCLASDLTDLEARLSRIVVAERFDRSPVTAGELGAAGAMTVLLKEALQPNLVQTLENNPVLVHGGPFANIAHGCNSVMATRTALKLADIVVTEAGFGADLGAEKFFNIKCRKAGLRPSAAVVVATIRSLKMNGGVSRKAIGTPDPEAVRRGCANLSLHLENLAKFGVPAVVALNHFNSDTPEEVAVVQAEAEKLGAVAVVCRHWAEGGAGAAELAEVVAGLCDGGAAEFRPLYPDEMSLAEKIETVAREIYRAGGVAFSDGARRQLTRFTEQGYGHLPVCMAKTPYSFTTDPAERGVPEGHIVEVRDVRLSAGAGFVVALTGDVMTMPGLPRKPAAEEIGLNAAGQVVGLF